MESRPNNPNPAIIAQTSAVLKQMRDRVDGIAARIEGGLPITAQSLRSLDVLVLDVMKQQILNGRERGLELLERARSSLVSVPFEEILKGEIGARRSSLVQKLKEVSELASTLSQAASPSAFNPLDYKVLGRSTASALDDSETYVMPPATRFRGVGVYALYYVGDFPPYRPLVEKHLPRPRVPIYIGRAVPEGSRIGGADTGKASLYGRLQLHAKSISEARSTLALEDFRYRYLIVLPAFVPLGEDVLLREYRPLWNSLLLGFGSNPAGGPRGGTRKSLWDTLHPGRVRAASFKDQWNKEELTLQVERYLRGEDVDQRLLKLASEAAASDASDEADTGNLL
jgi:hypothetical protein